METLYTCGPLALALNANVRPNLKQNLKRFEKILTVSIWHKMLTSLIHFLLHSQLSGPISIVALGLA